MKTIILSLIILVALAGTAATVRKGQSPAAVPPTLTGEWQGEYAVEDGPFVNPLFFQFGPNHELKVSDGPREWGDAASGDYTVSGDTLIARYHFADGIQDDIEVKALIRGDRLEGSWEWIKGRGKLVLSRDGKTVHRQETTVR